MSHDHVAYVKEESTLCPKSYFIKKLIKVCGCYLVPLSCSPTSTKEMYATKHVLHQQIFDETYAKIGLKIIPPLL